jgi:hypothetical protein
VNPRAVALQGIGYTPRLVALQGFGFFQPPVVETGAARRPRRHRPNVTFYDNVDATYNLEQLRQDDDAATDLIIALLTKGFFDGNFKP